MKNVSVIENNEKEEYSSPVDMNTRDDQKQTR